MRRRASVADVLDGRADPSQLRPDLADLWRDGFTAGNAAARARLEPLLAAADADADHWYFEANNPDEARAHRAQLASTASIDARAARQETAQRWAALDAATKEAS